MSILTDYQKAALAYNKHISLTANAGSGKTTVLAKRYVEILLNENISINNMVAITFTEKAASELYSKIAAELDLKISQSNKKYKLEAIRRSLVSAKISTIHSFCIDILKDYAPEAAIDANFSPIDSRTADDLLSQSIDDVINNRLSSNCNEVKRLIRIFNNKSQLVKKIKQLFGKRKSTEQLILNKYSGSIEEIQKWLESTFDEYFSELFKNRIELLIEEVNKINSIAKNYKSSEKQIEINYLLIEVNKHKSLVHKSILLDKIGDVLLSQKNEVIKRGYLSNNLYDDNTEIIQNISQIYKDLKNVQISENQKQLNFELANFGKVLSEFYIEINSRYSLKKQQKSYLDFEDLLLLTQKLLTNSEVKEQLAEKYQYIMIDEYQDTNETQYNIFMPILNNLDTGNLFIVGDEKQSIYRFREAEVELFNKTKKQLENNFTNAGILELPHSFRLSPHIALFTNVLFKELFKSPNRHFNEVFYDELVCAYTQEVKGEVEFLLTDENELSESDQVAKKIIKLVKSTDYDFCFSDITILCTKRKNFIELEKSFTELNIPFTIVGGKGFFQQQLIYDIYNYLSFLINPKNDLALASVLRSPYYGLSDVDLTLISFTEGISLLDKLSDNSLYTNIVDQLNKHIKAAKILRPNELIRKINIETAYWSYLGSKKNCEQEIANLEKLIQKSIQLDDQGFNSLYDFMQFLKDAIDNLEDEGQAEIDINQSSVKVMTVHQSKGLEFKVVILYKTNQKSFNEKLAAKEIAVDKEFGILAKLPVSNNYFSDYEEAPIIGLYNYIQNKRAQAELKRLLYVAITRAEQHLIISAGKKKESFWEDSFASFIFKTFSVKPDTEEVQLNNEVSFMRLLDDKYILTNEMLNYSINIDKNIDIVEEHQIIKEPANFITGEIDVGKIKSLEKNEIISASKISLFLNCPKKYQLTYEYGYGELTKLFRDQIDFEFEQKEDGTNIPGNIVGSITHAILEQDIINEDFHNRIIEMVEKDENAIFYNSERKKAITKEIVAILNKYFNSNSFQYLNQFDNSYNEIEFYKREYDYFLYGIIDKLIILDSKIIIVDYKSDKISADTINEKRETYLNQLLFYAYILANKYNSISQFELRLIFLRDDHYSVVQQISISKVLDFGKIIKSCVDKIRLADFSEKTQGCNNMKYYLLEKNIN